MSTEDTAAVEEPTQEGTDAAETVDTQETTETDWKSEARKWERRAKESVRFKELADKWLEYEKSQKPENERIAEELATLKQEAQSAKMALLRYEVARQKDVPISAAKLLTGETREELEEAADSLLELIANQSKSSPKPDSTQGQPVKGGTTTAQQFAAALSDII